MAQLCSSPWYRPQTDRLHNSAIKPTCCHNQTGGAILAFWYPQVSSVSDGDLNVFSGRCPQPGPDSPSVLHLGGPDTVHHGGASATVTGSRSVTVANHNTQKTTDPTTEDVIEPSTAPATQVLGSPPPHPLPADDQGTPAYVSGTGENESLHSHARHDKQQEKTKSGNRVKLSGCNKGKNSK